MAHLHAAANASSGGSGTEASPFNTYNAAYTAAAPSGDTIWLHEGHCFDPINSFFSRIKKSVTVKAYGLDTGLTRDDKLATYPMLDGMAYEPPSATGWTYEGDGVWSKPIGFSAPKRMFVETTKTGILISQRTIGTPYSRSPNATADNLTAIKTAIVGTDDIWHPAGSALDYRIFVYTGSASVNPADYYNGLGFVTADGTSLGGGGNEGVWVSATSGVHVETLQTRATTNGAIIITSMAAESVGTSDVTISDVFAHCVWNQGFRVGPLAENTATLQKLVSDVLITGCVGDSTSAATEQDRDQTYTNTAYLDMFNLSDRIDNVRVVDCESINSGHTGMALGCAMNNHFEPVNSGFLRHTVTFADWCTYARGLATSRCGSGCFVYQCTIDGQNVRSQVVSAKIVANVWTNMRASQRKPGTDQWLFVEAYITHRGIPLAGDDAYVYISVQGLVIAHNVADRPKNTGANNAPFVITTYDSGYTDDGYPNPDIDLNAMTFANNILIDSEARDFWFGQFAEGGSIAFQNLKNNIVYHADVPNPQIKWAGVLYDTNSLTGSSGNLFTDPLLSADLVPLAGSPAINAGYNIGTYYDLNDSLFAANPTIGAYEYGSTPSDGGSSGGGGSGASQSTFGIQINALRDADAVDAGYYVAACGRTSGWRGCGVFRSTDGTSYSAITSLSSAATIGVVTSGAMPDFAGKGFIADEATTITVRLYNGELSSVSFAQFLEGANACVVGSEILYFRTAVQNDDGTYTLSGFLRGRRGSEYAMATHEAGERFVLLNVNTVKRIAAPTSEIGRSYQFKAVTRGANLASAAPMTFTNEGAGLMPYSVSNIGGGRNADGDLLIQWLRRGRIDAGWRDYVDVPLGEAEERFEIDILDGDTVVRTLTATSLHNQIVTYYASEQVEDFSSLQSSVSIAIYPISDTVGRGYPAYATI